MRRDKSGCFFKRGALLGSPIRDIHEGRRDSVVVLGVEAEQRGLPGQVTLGHIHAYFLEYSKL